MTDANNLSIDRDDVELLLPWYVAGTLDTAETERIGAFLANTSEFDAQLTTLREDMDVTIHTNEAIRGPSVGALGRLMDAVEAEPKAPGIMQTASNGVFAGLERFLHALTPGRLGFAAMAAAALIVVQAGIIGSQFLQEPSGYQLAGEDADTAGARFLIEFKGNAGLADVTAFLEDNDAVIMSGPVNGAFYKVRVGDKVLDDAAQKALVKRLEENIAIVATILPSE